MKSGTTFLLLAPAVFALTVSMAAPAQAQATRTWVSGVGDDVNPCSRTAPCKTFAGAISKTAPGGEINCLDPGGFGAVTITKAMTIQCIGVEGGLLVAATNGIVVSAGANDDVYIHGLDIFGTINSNPLAGIKFNTGRALHVDQCIIRQFQNSNGVDGWGINFVPSTAAELFVNDTVIADNGNATGGGNIQVAPTGSNVVNVSLERVLMNDGGVGIRADGSNANPLRVQIADSLASGNIFNGFTAVAPTGKVTMMISHSTASNNANVGVLANGANAKVLIGDSVVSGNLVGVNTTSGGTLQSYQNNQIDLNGTDNTPVASVLLH